VEIILRTRRPKHSLQWRKSSVQEDSKNYLQCGLFLVREDPNTHCSRDYPPFKRTQAFTAVEKISRTRGLKNYLQWGSFLVREDPNTHCSGDYLPFKRTQTFTAVEIISRTRGPKYSLQCGLSPVQENSNTHCSGDYVHVTESLCPSSSFIGPERSIQDILH
jgi:hypothetical protein